MATTKKLKDRFPFLKNLLLPAFLYFDRKIKLKKVQNSQNLLEDLPKEEQEMWRERIALLKQCPENSMIPCVENAGKIINGKLIMHNGIKIDPFSYYDLVGLKMLMENRSIHEPQEEKIFMEVLRRIPEGGTMIELGSYWAFYSMWFANNVKSAKNFMIEPIQAFVQMGKNNFKTNGFEGHFTNAFIGESKVRQATPVICMNDFVKEHGIKEIDILHCDIQGFEVDMLKGATDLLKNKMVKYFFISTHSEEIHTECLQTMETYGYSVISSVRPHQSYSADGILVTQSQITDKITIAVSLKD